MDAMQTEFIQQMLGVQVPLSAFIRSVVLSREVAEELLQRVNLILCEKAQTFTPGTNFRAWAYRIAHLELRGYRRQLSRERRRLVFDDELVEQIASVIAEEAPAIDDRRKALRQCLARLGPSDRELLKRKYEMGLGAAQIAEHYSRKPGAIRQQLFRIRLALLTCMKSHDTSGRQG